MTSTLARGWAPLRGVLVGRDKYIDLPLPELYDLSTDPGEARNLASTRAERAQVLLNTLKGFNVAPPGRPQEETPETIERLRSLGYIGGGSATARERYTEDDDPKRLIAIEQGMQRAAEARRAGRSGEAVAMYESILAKRPDTEDAYRHLALTYWLTGQPQQAIATLETALKNGVTQREVRIKLGQYMTEAGQARRAIDLLATFANDDPDALIALGNAYVAAGRPADAIRTFTRLLTIDPANALAYQNIGIAELGARNAAAAEAALRHAVSLDPSLPGAHTALGVVLAGSNRRDEAIAMWKRAVDLDPQEGNALYNLTVNLDASGRKEEARAYGERFLAIAPPGRGCAPQSAGSSASSSVRPIGPPQMLEFERILMRIARPLCAGVIAVALLCAGRSSLQGQAPPATQGGAQQPTFRTTTSLVEVDAIVLDDQGRFVPGLLADDVTILEDGKRAGHPAVLHGHARPVEASRRRSGRCVGARTAPTGSSCCSSTKATWRSIPFSASSAAPSSSSASSSGPVISVASSSAAACSAASSRRAAPI